MSGHLRACTCVSPVCASEYMLYVWAPVCWRACTYVSVIGTWIWLSARGHIGFSAVCPRVCMNVQRRVSAVHAWLCAGVSTLRVCVCAVSPFMCQCWSLGIGVVSVQTYVRGDLPTRACLPGMRLTSLLGPVRLGAVWCDLWYAGVPLGGGSKDTSVSACRAKSPWRVGAHILLVCPWKSRCGDLDCGSMWVLACLHTLVWQWYDGEDGGL